MVYEIKTITDISEIDKGNIAEINKYNWSGEYRPYAYGKLCYIKNQGFAVKLMCRETNPRAIYTEQNSPVCKDSCLEFFANFKPDIEGLGYINFEGNANGSLLCCYGTVVYPRQTIEDMGLEHPIPSVIKTEDSWGYTVFLPLETIKAIYGNADYEIGDHIRGNFFKCGDDTDIPHFGSYTEIDFPHPSFHQPQFFADMVIVE